MWCIKWLEITKIPLLHISRDMWMFGCPQNLDASPGEHNLIDFAKQLARGAQKQQSSFLDQVAEHLYETSCIGRHYTWYHQILCK